MTGLLVAMSVLCADAPPEGKRNRRVAVLPVSDYALTADGIWIRTSEPDREVQALERFLVRRLAVEPTLEVVGPADIEERLSQIRIHREGARLGQQQMQHGMALYRDLNVRQAVPYLERAHAALTTAMFDIVDPAAMGELSLTLALCYQELGKADRTHVALKEMFLRDPTRRFQPGFYSKAFESALRSAVTDFVATWPRENPLGTQARLERFMDDVGADVLVYAWLEPTEGGREVRIAVHDRESRNVSHRSQCEKTDRAADLERVDRFVSRWTTCLPPQIGEDPTPTEKPFDFYLDTAFSYSLFASLTGSDPLTSEPFHNLGMSVNLEWQFLSGLGAFFELDMHVSTQDPERDLTNTFPSLTTAGGMFYAYSSEKWRVFTRFGVGAEFLLSEFTVTKDPWCKWNHAPNCPATATTTYTDELLLGFYAAVGGNIFMAENLYTTVRIGVTAYIFPSERVNLNFPLTFEAGLGYRF